MIEATLKIALNVPYNVPYNVVCICAAVVYPCLF